MEEIEEEESDHFEEDKFEQMMNDLCDYCHGHQIPLLCHENSIDIMKSLLNLNDLF